MTLSSNIVAFYIGAEDTLKTLPGSPVFYGLEPNEIEFSANELTSVARSPISPSRQDSKGTNTDLNPTARVGFDWTRTSFLRELRCFFWSAPVEQPTTAPLHAAAITITAVTSTEYEAASGLAIFNTANALVYGENFGVVGNNGLHLVTSADGTGVTAAGLAAEASPPATARITVVGKQYASADVVVAETDGIITLASTASAFPSGIVDGEWLLVGGDASNTFFATCPRFYGRVRTATTALITFDDVITVGGGAVVDDTGTGKTIQIFTSSAFWRNGTTRFTSTAELQVGSGPTATQAIYEEGMAANELSWTYSGQDKITASASWMACESYFATGESGDEIVTATRVSDPAEDAFNTSTDVNFTKLAVVGLTSSQSPLFAYAAESTLSLTNNVRMSKALGVFGAIDVQPGNFQASAEVQAYFNGSVDDDEAGVTALASIRENPDVSYTKGVFSSAQTGFIKDLPLSTLSGNVTISKDADVMVPLTMAGAKNSFGFTLGYYHFAYAPEAFADAELS